MNKSKSNNWGTPERILNLLPKDYHDVCPFNHTNNSLIEDWGKYKKTIFCNPPYSDLKTWIKKCYTESLKKIKIILLIPARTDTIAFHKYIYNKSKIKFIKGRLKYIDLDNSSKKPTSAPFPSMLIYYNF